MDYVYTLRETAREAGVPYQALNYLVRTGAIPAKKKGRRWFIDTPMHHEIVAWYKLGGDCHRCHKRKANFRWRTLGPYCADCGRAIRSAKERAKRKMLQSSHFLAQGEALALKESVFSNQIDIALLAALQVCAVLQLSEIPLVDAGSFAMAMRLLGLKMDDREIKERLDSADWIKVDWVDLANMTQEDEEEKNG